MENTVGTALVRLESWSQVDKGGHVVDSGHLTPHCQQLYVCAFEPKARCRVSRKASMSTAVVCKSIYHHLCTLPAKERNRN